MAFEPPPPPRAVSCPSSFQRTPGHQGPDGRSRVESGGPVAGGSREARRTVQAAMRPPEVSLRCAVCGDTPSGNYFGATVCLPCKSFYIRCTKEGEGMIKRQCGGCCVINKHLRNRCQFCRFRRCVAIGMLRKDKPTVVLAGEGIELCRVCGDVANGVHFGVHTCEGCKKFFRRGLRECRRYVCRLGRTCPLNPRTRNTCRHCRFQRCLAAGMSRTAIKMGRPRKSFTHNTRRAKHFATNDRNSHKSHASFVRNAAAAATATLKNTREDAVPQGHYRHQRPRNLRPPPRTSHIHSHRLLLAPNSRLRVTVVKLPNTIAVAQAAPSRVPCTDHRHVRRSNLICSPGVHRPSTHSLPSFPRETNAGVKSAGDLNRDLHPRAFLPGNGEAWSSTVDPLCRPPPDIGHRKADSSHTAVYPPLNSCKREAELPTTNVAAGAAPSQISCFGHCHARRSNLTCCLPPGNSTPRCSYEQSRNVWQVTRTDRNEPTIKESSHSRCLGGYMIASCNTLRGCQTNIHKCEKREHFQGDCPRARSANSSHRGVVPATSTAERNNSHKFNSDTSRYDLTPIHASHSTQRLNDSSEVMYPKVSNNRSSNHHPCFVNPCHKCTAMHQNGNRRTCTRVNVINNDGTRCRFECHHAGLSCCQSPCSCKCIRGLAAETNCHTSQGGRINGECLPKPRTEISNVNGCVKSNIIGPYASSASPESSYIATGSVETVGRHLQTNRMNSQTSRINSQTNSMNSQTSNMNSQTSSMDSLTGSQTSRMNSQTRSMTSQMSNMNSQTSSVDGLTGSQTSSMNSQTSNINSQTSRMNSQTSNMNSQTSRMNSQTSSMNSQMGSQMSNQTSNMNILMSSMNSDTSSMNNQMSNMNSQRSSLSSRVSNMNNQTSNTSSKASSHAGTHSGVRMNPQQPHQGSDSILKEMLQITNSDHTKRPINSSNLRASQSVEGARHVVHDFSLKPLDLSCPQKPDCTSHATPKRNFVAIM